MKPKILLVDDQVMIRDYLKVGLRDFADSCDAAGNHDDFVGLIKERVYDVILLDHGLPRVSGLEILYGIRSGEYACPYDTRVAMITGHTDLPFIKQARVFDIDALIAKPFSIAQLTQKISRILQQEDAKKDVAYYQTCLRQHAEELCVLKRWPATVVMPGKPLWYTAEELEKATKREDPIPVELIFLRPGMRLAENVYAPSGQLLIGRGVELTERLVQHLQLMSAEQLPSQAVLVLAE